MKNRRIVILLIAAVVDVGHGNATVGPAPPAVQSHVEGKQTPPPPPAEHEDGRCRCVCPRLSALLERFPLNLTLKIRFIRIYIISGPNLVLSSKSYI